MRSAFRTITVRLLDRCLAAGFLAAFVWLAVLPCEARQVEITVLNTTDLHGHILPGTDYAGRENVGGLLRCATLIHQLRNEHPNSLLIDCGDLYQGTAESYLTEGRIMVRALDMLNYDAWVLGNHEFDWGLSKMKRLIGASLTPVLAANIVARRGYPIPFPSVSPYIIREVDGVKVAIIGLITPGVPRWSTPDLFGEALFEKSVDALRRIMPLVRAEQPDVLLLAAHQGCKVNGDDHANEINAIAAEFPEFDVIVGGHTHRAIPEMWLKDRILYTQAGYHGIWLGQLDLTYDTVARQVIAKSAKLHHVDETIPNDPQMEAEFAPELEKAKTYLNRVIGNVTTPITWAGDEFGSSPVQALIARSIAAAAGADLALHGVLSEENLNPGEIKMADLWRIVPYENRIAVVQVTPGELIEILDENASARSSISLMGLYGAKYEWKDGPDGKRHPANLTLPDGTSPHPRLRLNLALNSFSVASGGGRYMKLREIAERPESRLRILEIDTRTAVLDYLKRHSPLNAETLLGSP